jgi:hypothetical protein
VLVLADNAKRGRIGMVAIITDAATATKLMEQLRRPDGPGEPSADIPPVRTRVTEVRGDLATLDAGAETGVTEGMRFNIFRGSIYLSEGVVITTEAKKCVVRLQIRKGEVRKGDRASNMLGK